MNRAFQILFVASILTSAVWGTGASLFMGLAALLYIVEWIRGNAKPPLKSWPFWSYYGVYILGMLWTDNMESGGFSLQVKLSFLVLPPLVYHAVAIGLNRLHFKWILTATIAISLAVMGVDVYQNVNAGQSFWYTVSGSQISLPYMHRAYFMNYIYLAILAWTYFGKFKWQSNVVILLLGVIFWFLQGRMNILVALALVPAMWWLSRKGNQPGRWVVGLAMLILFGVLHFAELTPSRFEADMGTELDLGEDGEAPEKNSRAYLWKSAGEVYLRHPFLGVGTGDAGDEMVAQFARSDYEFGLEREYNAHNEYAQTLMTLGPLGLIALLLLFLPALKTAWVNRDSAYVLWTVYFAGVILTEVYFNRFHGVYLYALSASFLGATTKRE